MRRRILVIGGDGIIGSALVKALEGRGDVVFATTRREGQNGIGRLRLDLEDSDIESVNLPQADVAVFCAAVTGFGRCRTFPSLARQVNVTATSALARKLVSQGTRVILLSTTAVFDLQVPNVPANAPVRPLSIIGQVKAEAEAEFIKMGAAASILRLTKVLTKDAALFTNWMAALWQHQRVVAFSDLYIAPLTLDQVTNAVVTIFKDPSGGIYQISSAHDISYFEAARYLAQRMQLDVNYVRRELAIDNNIPSDEIARYTSLDSSRLAALTDQPPSSPYEVLELVYGPAIDTGLKKWRGAIWNS